MIALANPSLLVANKVNIVFHGHDHLFVKQDLDGIVYQEVPQPSAARSDATNSAKVLRKGYFDFGQMGHYDFGLTGRIFYLTLCEFLCKIAHFVKYLVSKIFSL